MSDHSIVSRLAFYGGLLAGGAALSWAAAGGLATLPASAEEASAAAFAGPVIPGLCVLSRPAVFDNSKIGKAANARYTQLRDAAKSEIDGEEKQIVADAKALEEKKKSLSSDKYQERQVALNKRLADLRAKAAQRSRELDATRQDVASRISTEAQSVIASVYKARKCGILVARESVLAGNPAMDVTADVVSGLDAKITTISFDRIQLTSAASKPVQE